MFFFPRWWVRGDKTIIPHFFPFSFCTEYAIHLLEMKTPRQVCHHNIIQVTLAEVDGQLRSRSEPRFACGVGDFGFRVSRRSSVVSATSFRLCTHFLIRTLSMSFLNDSDSFAPLETADVIRSLLSVHSRAFAFFFCSSLMVIGATS